MLIGGRVLAERMDGVRILQAPLQGPVPPVKSGTENKFAPVVIAGVCVWSGKGGFLVLGGRVGY